MILSGLYPPYARGGAETVASSLANELREFGHTVSVMTTAKKSTIEKVGNIQIYTLRPRNIFWYGEIGRFSFFTRVIWHCFDIFNFWQCREVRKILKKEKPDIVWSHNLKGLGFLIPRMLKKEKFRHIHTLHDIQLIEASGVSVALNLKSSFYSRLTKKLFGSPDIVTSPSQWLLSFYQNFNFFSRSAGYILPHVFGEKPFGEMRVNKNNKLLYLGQLEATKGVPFLFEIAHEQNLSLIIVGNGSLQPYVQNSDFDYRGRLEGEELEQVWGEADFLVVPSLIVENSPTVILEAFSHGVPVIASKIGGIPELIQDGENGFLFEPGNRQSFKEAIKKAKIADYAYLSQKTRERYQVLRDLHIKGLNEIMASLS